MAEVTCPHCGWPRAAGRRFCTKCLRAYDEQAGPPQPENPIGVPTIQADEVEVQVEATGPHRQVDCRYCGESNVVGQPACDRCGARDPDGSSVVEVSIHGRIAATLSRREGDRFELGRSSTLDPQMVIALNPYDHISRHHASVSLLRRRVEITDRSVNGTTVNGQLLEHGVARTFDLPVTVRLGDECDVNVALRR